jgi:predicted oxidoreductase
MVSTNGSHPPSPYEQKFADFIRMLVETKLDTILIHHPEVLGDNYEEIVESLNRVADSGKKLVIIPRTERG